MPSENSNGNLKRENAIIARDTMGIAGGSK